jgi:hypothetical protein
MNSYTTVIILALFSGIVKAQPNSKKFFSPNSIQMELSGMGDNFIPVSLTYERIFHQTNKFGFLVKAGGTYQPIGQHTQKAVTLEAGMVSQAYRHHWEIGLFGMMQDKEINNKEARFVSPKSNGHLALRLGYRYQQPQKSWVIRTGVLIPFIYGTNSGMVIPGRQSKIRNVFFPWPAISVGRAF